MGYFVRKEYTPIPDGVYGVAFDGIDSGEHAEYGPNLQWKFSVDEGKYSGWKLSKITGVEPSKKANCGIFLEAVTGSRDDDDIASRVGHKYFCLVGHRDCDGQSYNTIEKVWAKTIDSSEESIVKLFDAAAGGEGSQRSDVKKKGKN